MVFSVAAAKLIHFLDALLFASSIAVHCVDAGGLDRLAISASCRPWNVPSLTSAICRPRNVPSLIPTICRP